VKDKNSDARTDQNAIYTVSKKTGHAYYVS